MKKQILEDVKRKTEESTDCLQLGRGWWSGRWERGKVGVVREGRILEEHLFKGFSGVSSLGKDWGDSRRNCGRTWRNERR